MPPPNRAGRTTSTTTVNRSSTTSQPTATCPAYSSSIGSACGGRRRSITDAAMLTLQAATMPKGAEILVLKMPVIRLGDLADVVIEETCRKHGISQSEVRRQEIGLRFGEKMFEELMTIEESKFGFELPDMYAICQAYFAFAGKKAVIVKNTYRSD